MGLGRHRCGLRGLCGRSSRMGDGIVERRVASRLTALWLSVVLGVVLLLWCRGWLWGFGWGFG